MKRSQIRESADTLKAARALRSAAALTDRARRADAVWDGTGPIRRLPLAADLLLESLGDDGSGEAPPPARGILLAAARRLERLASTARGLDMARGTAPGRTRSHALRADHPTTTKRRRRHRHRRRRS